MYSRLSRWGSAWRHAILLLCTVFALFPVAWIVSASFQPGNSLLLQTLIPAHPTLVHYRELFANPQHPFGLWIVNSVKIALITAVGNVTLTALAAYPFSRFRFRGRRAGLFALLLVQLFPQMLAMVAIYLLLLAIGEYIPALGLNTHAGLVMVYLGGALGVNTWLMKGFFDTIPRSLEESAQIDGATPFQAFARIVLPLSRPILAVIFILSFIGVYSEYLLARVLLSSDRLYTLSVGLQLFVQNQYATRWGVFAAAAVLGALPILTLFLLAQRYLVSGLTQGAVKG